MDVITTAITNYFSSPIVVFGFLCAAIPGFLMVAGAVIYRRQRQLNPYPKTQDIECDAIAPEVNAAEPVKVYISAQKLPADGESIRALCKLPKVTPEGLDYAGMVYEWRLVQAKAGQVFVGKAT